MIPLTSENVQGVLDDAIYTATLCMARDAKHYFFTAIHVDGASVGAPNKRWSSRSAAMAALADIASAHRKPEGEVLPSSIDSLITGSVADLLRDADDLAALRLGDSVAANPDAEASNESEAEQKSRPVE